VRLARLGGDHAGHVGRAALEQLGDLAQDAPALDRRGARPARLGGLGGADGGVDVLGARARDVRQQLARRWGELLDRLAARGRALGPADDVGDGAGARR
jgi:hypothetical protein